MADTVDTLQRILDDPEVRLAAKEVGEPTEGQDDLPALHTLQGALPPDLLAKLPALMGALGPLMGSTAGSGKRDEKTALLLALKPYMSPGRCDAIDKLIMLGRIGEVINHLK